MPQPAYWQGLRRPWSSIQCLNSPQHPLSLCNSSNLHNSPWQGFTLRHFWGAASSQEARICQFWTITWWFWLTTEVRWNELPSFQRSALHMLETLLPLHHLHVSFRNKLSGPVLPTLKTFTILAAAIKHHFVHVLINVWCWELKKYLSLLSGKSRGKESISS